MLPPGGNRDDDHDADHHDDEDDNDDGDHLLRPHPPESNASNLKQVVAIAQVPLLDIRSLIMIVLKRVNTNLKVNVLLGKNYFHPSRKFFYLSIIDDLN